MVRSPIEFLELLLSPLAAAVSRPEADSWQRHCSIIQKRLLFLELSAEQVLV